MSKEKQNREIFTKGERFGFFLGKRYEAHGGCELKTEMNSMSIRYFFCLLVNHLFFYQKYYFR